LRISAVFVQKELDSYIQFRRN